MGAKAELALYDHSFLGESSHFVNKIIIYLIFQLISHIKW